MKTHTFSKWLLLSSFIALYSCMSDTPEDPAPIEKGDKITIKVSMPQENKNMHEEKEESGRIAYDDTNLDLTWENGDQLRLVGYNSAGNFVGTTDFTLNGETGTQYSTFSGREVPNATHYDIYYPTRAINEQGQVVMNYLNQTQKADNSTEHLKKFLFLKSTKRVTSHELQLEDNDIPLSMQNSIIRFDLVNIPNTFITKIKSVRNLEWGIVNPKETKSLILNFDNMKLTNQKLTAFMCFQNMDVAKDGIVRVFLQGTGEDFSIFDKCSFEVKVNKEIIYQSNRRYVAEIDFQNDELRNNRIYYTNDFEFKADHFAPKPIKTAYDSNTGKGHLDFEKEWLIKRNITLKNNAFENDQQITKVIIPEGVNVIEENAFKGCTNITNIVLPSTITKIEHNAFEGCTSLQEITLPEGLQTVRAELFKDCTSLEKVVFPSTVSDIRVDVFTGCTNLKELHIQSVNPPSVTKLYPFSKPTEKNNPLGLPIDDKNFKIYIPQGTIDNYSKNSGRNPWYNYRNHFVEE